MVTFDEHNFHGKLANNKKLFTHGAAYKNVCYSFTFEKVVLDLKKFSYVCLMHITEESLLSIQIDKYEKGSIRF